MNGDLAVSGSDAPEERSLRVFVDPMVYSERLQRIQLASLGAILLAAFVGLWIKWYVGGAGESELRFTLMLSSVVVVAFFAGYYMMKRTRRVLMEHLWFGVDGTGFVSVTPAGEVRADWSEVRRISVSVRPARSKSPDVNIDLGRGRVGLFMRWRDKSGTMPEPVVLSGGIRFRDPGGGAWTLTPDNSELVGALVELAGPDRIERGVLTSL